MKNLLSILVCVCIGLIGTTVGAQDEAPPKKQDSETKQVESPKVDEPAPITFLVGDDKLEFTSTGTWKKVMPKSNMLEAEFKILKVADDPADGRLTIMGAGGGIEPNIIRWQGQFEGEKEFTRTETTVNGQKVYMIDIKGTFMEGGFRGPKTKREKYQMLAAIVATEKYGLYFVKFTGPQPTLKANKKHFEDLVKSLKIIEPENKDK